MISNLGGIVLAGGQSRRMGQDKALIPFGNSTLLEHIVTVLRKLTPTVVVVAATADKYVVEGCRVVGDRFPDQGPIGGIITGLEAIQKHNAAITRCLVVACDMPYLDAEVLAQFALLGGIDNEAVVPISAQGIEPLCACYHLDALPKLQAFFDAGGRSIRKALDCLCIERVSSALWQETDPHEKMFTNWNTLEESRNLSASE